MVMTKNLIISLVGDLTNLAKPNKGFQKIKKNRAPKKLGISSR